MLCEIPEAVLSQTHSTYQKKSDFLFVSKKAATIGNKQLQMEDKQKKHGNGSGIFPPPHKHTYHKLLPPDHDDAKLADDTQIMRHFAIFTKLKTCTQNTHTHRKHIQYMWCLSDPGDCPVTNTPVLFDDQQKHVFHWNGQACRLCPFFSSTMLFLAFFPSKCINDVPSPTAPWV